MYNLLKTRLIIFLSLTLSFTGILSQNTSQVIQQTRTQNNSFINGFSAVSVYNINFYHFVWDEYIPTDKVIKTIFVEKSTDGVSWNVVTTKSADDIIDIHVNNYPDNIEMTGNIVYSTEVGHGRYIYNEENSSIEIDNPLIKFRAGFITTDNHYYYTRAAGVNNGDAEEGWRFADKLEVDSTISLTKDKKPPVITTKTVCPAIGSPPSGSTNTGQTQVYYGSCCTWTETMYSLPSTFQIACGGSSYAWCCNNVSGVSCSSGYWWDPCCVHQCTEFNSCSCHPWECCTMIPGQDVWIVTSSTPFSGFQVTTQITDETCPNTSDGSVALTPVGGTAPYSYSWANGMSSSSLYYLTAGNYSCTVTDANGCTVDVSVDIVSNPAPIADAGADVNMCNGASTTLTATGGVSYLWDNGSTTQSITVNPTSAQTYIVTVTNSYGCQSTDDVTVTTFDITSPFTVTTPICLENSTTVTYTGNGTGAATYNWNLNGGSIISGSGAGPIEVQWNTGGNHDITLVVNEPGCFASQPTTMSVNVVDIVNVESENDPLCFGASDGSVVVMPNGGQSPYTYLWSPGGETTAVVAGLPQGNYMVTVTDVLGCIETDTLTLTDPPLLNSNIINTKHVSCFGGNDGETMISAFGGTAPYAYNWSPVSGTTNIITGLIAGTYFVTVTDGHGCVDSQNVVITEPTLLVSSITDSLDLICNGIATGKATVSASGGVTPYTYNWNSNPPQTTPTANNLLAGTYTVTITDDHGCTSYSTVTLDQPPALSISLTPTNEHCLGDCNGEVQVSASGGTPGYTYSWNTNPVQTSSTASNLCVGNWEVTVKDTNGCIITNNASVYTNSLITAAYIATPQAGFVPINVNFVFTGSGAMTYNWDFGDGFSSTDQNPAHLYTTAGTYTVKLTVNSGSPDFCEDTYVINISFENPSSVIIPNVFTPNNDGHNDVFKAETVSMAEETMTIFNRWGKKIYEWTNLGGSWDGENHSDGTYYYIYYGKGRDQVEYNYHGTVTLLRTK